jgi:predicted alpha-1,2-mannosidase
MPDRQPFWKQRGDTMAIFARARRRSAVAAAVLAVAVTTVSPAVAVATPSAQATSDPVALVDPFIGTGSGGVHVGDVDAFPGASVPFGMVQFSPDTPRRPAGGGYAYDDTSITGFSLTHLSGVGCGIGGDIPFLPLAGAIPADPDHASLPFSHDAEHASPGAYGVTLGDAVQADVTATRRTGLATLTYPATDQAQLLVKVSGSQGAPSNATFHTIGGNEVAGSVTNGHFCGQPDSYTVYFDAKFDRSFTTSGTWGGASAAVQAGNTSVTAKGHPQVRPGKAEDAPASSRLSTNATSAPGSVVAGGYVTFDTRATRTVGMQVALSYVSEDGARANRIAETTSVGAARSAAAAAWNQQLGKIAITGGSSAERTSFYTALYHASLHPSLFSDADGRYIGFDNKIHSVPRGHDQYAYYSGWDIYRSQIPLLALIDPAQASDMVSSLLRDGDQMGFLPKWPVANGESGVMNGDAADPIIAGAYAFGARDFDVRHAVDEMVHGAEASGPPAQGWYVERPSGAEYLANGYVPNTQATSISPVPNGASETQEYAIADLAVAQLANAAGRTDVASRFSSRAQNWSNIFNTSTGYVQPRDADGAFPSGDPLQITNGFGQSGFQEGNTAQYTWMVPQNLPALIGGIGGKAAAQARLDEYFTELNAGPNDPHHWQGNEPTFATPWVYNAAGAPWKTQATVRRIQSELYQPVPGGEPGNDDLGAMSSWYVWASLGVYPQVAGTSLLSVNSPLFSRIVIDAGQGRRVEINAPDAGDSRPYVDGLRVNGHSTTRTWLTLPAGPGVTRLDFTLDSQPNRSWGTGPNDGTPSFAPGPVTFPPSTRAFVHTDPTALHLAGGESATADVIVDNTLGSNPASVTWTATPTTGIAVSPTTGTAATPAGGTSSSNIEVSAPADVRDGLYEVTITAHDSNGAILPTAHLRITVGHPAQAYVSNYSDNTVTPVDTVTDTAGAPIATGSGPDGVVVLPNNSEAYVANNNTNDVTVISTADNHVITTIPVGSIAADVAASADSTTVWVSNYGDGTIQPIDTTTHTAGAPITVGPNPQRLRFSPDGSQIWVPDQGNGTVSVVDVATKAVVHTITVGPAPFGVAFGQNKAYVSNTGNGTLSIIDTSSYAVIGTLNVPAPNGLANTGDLGLVYASLNGGGVQPINTDKDLLGTPITFGSGTYAVRFTDDGSTAWAVDSNTNDIQQIDVATGTLGAKVTVGNVPDGIGLTH